MERRHRHYKEVSYCLDEAYRCLTVVGGNLNGLLQDLNAPPECLAFLLTDLTRLDKETRNLSQNLDSFLLAQGEAARQQAATVTSMADRCGEVEELRSKVTALQRENDKVCAQLSITQGDNTRLLTQLTQQSAFCASLGSVLGNLVWKASRVPPVVDLLLSGNKAADFLCIVSSTLESFLETYDTEMPQPSGDESQFIMAMGGIVTNIAAAPAGRQFLVSDPNGRDLLRQIIRVLPSIPTPSGNCLKRLLLMALYNVSINLGGHSLLHEDGNGAIFAVAKDCLKPDSTSELRIMAMRLLVSLTCEINDPTLILQVPQNLIAEFTNSDDPELKSMALEVNENIFKAQERLRKEFKNDIGLSQPIGKPMQTTRVEVDGSEADKTQHPPSTAWRLPSHS